MSTNENATTASAERDALARLRKTILLDDTLWAEASPGIAINRILSTIADLMRAHDTTANPTKETR